MERLTTRELAVLRLMAQEQATVQMAESLSISRGALRTHIQNILIKLNAHSRHEAVAIAKRLGLLGRGSPGPG